MAHTTTEKIIKAIIHNLDKSTPLYKKLDNHSFTDYSIPPYFSSIGMHLRHTLDVYSCVISGINSGVIDLTQRQRNGSVESDQNEAYNYLVKTKYHLQEIIRINPVSPVTVLDDLGLGVVSIESTCASILSQAHSHTIHHYAIISYLLESMDVKIPELELGYNPTTPVIEYSG